MAWSIPERKRNGKSSCNPVADHIYIVSAALEILNETGNSSQFLLHYRKYNNSVDNGMVRQHRL